MPEPVTTSSGGLDGTEQPKTSDGEELPPTLRGTGTRRATFAYTILRATPTYMTAVLLAIVVVFSITHPDSFATGVNLRNVLLDSSFFLILGIGLTFVMVAGELDLSIGSVLVFSSITSGKVMLALGGDGLSTVLVGLGVALLSGLAWGLLNGFLVTKARVPSLITTLGTLGAALGLTNIIADGSDVRSVPSALTDFGYARLFGVIPWLVVVTAAITIVAGFYLHASRFGRRSYVLGSNKEAARRAGIEVDRHVIALFALSGACAGLVGFLDMARFSTTSITGHSNDIILVIAAVVLGGTSLYGGQGSILGTVIGVLIPNCLATGFIISGIRPFWQQVATGAILILAVYVDQQKRQARERA